MNMSTNHLYKIVAVRACDTFRNVQFLPLLLAKIFLGTVYQFKNNLRELCAFLMNFTWFEQLLISLLYLH